MKAKDLLSACFLVFGTLLVWPMLSIANRPALVVLVALLPELQARCVRTIAELLWWQRLAPPR